MGPFAEPTVGFERGELVAIDGQGERGVCSGDSGGPVFVLAGPDRRRPPRRRRPLHSDRRLEPTRRLIESFTGPT
ncbi:MAG TPA: hypothetical protein DEF51_05035, partial [Myxococcales bacterium]|nr:hypothetical protein [Myxococcales bacterium]